MAIDLHTLHRVLMIDEVHMVLYVIDEHHMFLPSGQERDYLEADSRRNNWKSLHPCQYTNKAYQCSQSLQFELYVCYSHDNRFRVQHEI